MLSSPSAITEMKSSCQAPSGFLCCPTLSFSTVRTFIWGALFRQYHGSEVGPWNCLVALHRSARVEWSPGKCQISLIFSSLFTDFPTPWHEQWEEGGAPYAHPSQRAQVQTQCRMAHSLLWHPEQWFSQGPLAGRATCDSTHHCIPQDSSCIMACASPSCSLRNLGGKTESIFLRAVIQPGQIQLTPFFLIFTSSSCVSSCPV